MKMCPWNREDTVEAERMTRLSIEHPELAKSIADLDDFAGNGARNPVKRWWFDLEVVNGIAIHPVAGINERDLDMGRMRLGEKQKLRRARAARYALDQHRHALQHHLCQLLHRIEPDQRPPRLHHSGRGGSLPR